ncbi:uncharacterized protein LOC117182307 [Belonocnema kinseyi]|uniref:uncharacterized protein LOC117182307 n=1 Tax=Belonocnema kinseyi TaxID=2817044 RepID=UPI00143D3E9F|nr:uncharacterized protein LOC117182307 [Belonocnema kinseyi]
MERKAKKLFFLSFFFVLQYSHVKGIEVDYIAAELENISEEYFLKENTFAYVDSDRDPPCVISNVTIIKDIPDEVQVRLTAYGFSMGEYRVPVGMEYTSPFCELYKEELFLAPAMEGVGFHENACPPLAGTYINTGYVGDSSKYPEAFPRNQYLISLEMTLDDEPIIALKLYVEVI